MGLFRKKINETKAKDFFVNAYSQTLSEREMAHNEEKLSELKEALPILKNVKQKIFDDNLSAVNIALLNIAWTKYYAIRGVDMLDAVRFKSSIEDDIEAKVPEYEAIDYLVDRYSDAFGPSSNGMHLMAQIFVTELLEDKYEQALSSSSSDVTDTILTISNLFVGTYDILKATIKRGKLLK